MSTSTRKGLFCALLVVVFAVVLALPAILFGQDGTTPAATEPVTLGLKIVIVAGVVSTILQGVKRLLPAIQGNVAKVIVVISAIAAVYAAAPPEGVLSVMFALQMLGTVFATLGVHGLAKTAGGG